jgi:hypothetical protein
MGHTIGDNAFLNNHAAQDDVVAPAAATIDISALLANDPGSAVFVGFYDPSHPGLTAGHTTGLTSLDGGGITWDGGHTITFNDPTVTGFDYIVRMANGTFSTAHVTLTPHLSEELVVNSDFTDPSVPSGGWTGFQSIPGWNNDSGQSLELISNAYLPGMTGGDPTNQSLDSEASPGGVTISQTLADFAGGKVLITVKVAAEQVAGYTPDGDLTVSWNNTPVLTLHPGDLPDDNSFHTFTVSVDPSLVLGGDKITIHDSSTTGYAGYAVDFVSAKEWIV